MNIDRAPGSAPTLGAAEDAAALNRRIAALEIEKTRLDVLVASGQAEFADATRRYEGRLAEARDDLARAQAELARLRKYALLLETRYAAVLQSRTWRALEPIRALSRVLTGRSAPAPFIPRLGNRDDATADDRSRRDASSALLLEASPSFVSRSEKVIAFLATYPARSGNLPRIVAAILPQCDVLNVYLNDYDVVPDCLKHEKVVAILGKFATGDLKDNGKFFNVADYPDAYHLFIDDDLIYPPDYVQRLVAGIRSFGFRAIVGLHGVTYRDPVESYVNDRIVLPFYAQSLSAFVDQLGTGTLGYHTSTFSIDLSAFETQEMADLWFARHAAECGVPMVALERPGDWLLAMPETDDTIFRRLSRDDTPESVLLRDRLAPALRRGPRGRMVRFVEALYTSTHLERHGFNLDLSRSGAFGNSGKEPHAASTLRFAIIVAGWNCADCVEACMASIERQEVGDFTLEIYAYDDASEDATWDRLSDCAARLRLRLFRGESNLGPAFARDFLIRQIEDRDAICVLLDMDDALLPRALKTLERAYRENPACRMTYGNWINQHGVVNDEGRYSAAEIDDRAYRRQDLFKFTHLRSFRRFLYDKVEATYLQDANGEWLRYCSDVGLLLPIADQCASDNIVAIEEPIYLYNQYRPLGTQNRFGEYKKSLFKYLQEFGHSLEN